MNGIDENGYGEYIRHRREELGITQKDLADVVSCTSQAISKYEKGLTKIPLDRLGLFARGLQVDIESFLAKKDLKTSDLADRNDFKTKDFRKALQDLREDKGITQKDLSKATGIPAKDLSGFENGPTILPSLSEFASLAEFYGLPYEKLYFADIPSAAALLRKKKATQQKKGLLIGALSAFAGLLLVTSFVVPFTVRKATGQSASSLPDSSVSDLVTVTYDYQSFLPTQTRTIPRNGHAPDLPISKEGLILRGYRAANSSDYFDFSTPITEDITLYGEITQERFTVTFYGYQNVLLAQADTAYGDPALAPDPPDVADLIFVNWDTDFSCVKSNLEVHAIYGREKATLVFQLPEKATMDSYLSLSSFTDYTRDLFTTIPDAVLDGSVFDGWYADGKLFTKDTSLEDTMTLIPHFTPIEKHTITFAASDFTLSPLAVTYGETIAELPIRYSESKRIAGYAYDGKEVTLPFRYEYHQDILLTPILADSNYTYTIGSDSSATLTGVSAAEPVMVIPEKIGEHPIVSLADALFQGQDTVTEITVEAALTSIGDSAFADMTSLTSLTLRNISSATKIGKGILTHDAALTYLMTCPQATQSNGGKMMLYDYGFPASQGKMTLAFNEKTTSYPSDFLLREPPYDFEQVIFPGSIKDLVLPNGSYQNLCRLRFEEGIESLTFDSSYPEVRMERFVLPKSVKRFCGRITEKLLDAFVVTASDFTLDGYLDSIPEPGVFVDLSRVQHLHLGTSYASSFVDFAKVIALPPDVSDESGNAFTGDRNFLKVHSYYQKGAQNGKTDAYFFGTSALPSSYSGFTWLRNEENLDVTMHYENA